MKEYPDDYTPDFYEIVPAENRCSYYVRNIFPMPMDKFDKEKNNDFFVRKVIEFE